MLDKRKKQVLQAIVEEYINTAEPVSSNALTKNHGLDCSSATIRNEMADLEKSGYLDKTHTSSGRIPSEKGYRYYDWNVDADDAGHAYSSSQVYNNVVNHLSYNRANMVLMHDIKPYSVDAVESIIMYGLANGYTFAPLTLNSPNVHQKINN